MKVLFSSEVALADWQAKTEPAHVFKLGLEKLSSTCIWSTDPTEIAVTKESIKLAPNDSAKYVLEQYLRRIPRTGPLATNFCINQSTGELGPLWSLISSLQFEEAVANFDIPPQIGESREEVAKRLLLTLTQSASSVHVIDAWFGPNLLRPESGSRWLLDWLVDHGSLKIIIHTEVPVTEMSKGIQGPSKQRALQLNRVLEDLMGHDAQRIELRTYHAKTNDTDFPHDRELNFRFANDVSVGVALGKGGEIFEDEFFRDVPHIYELSQKHVATRMKQLRNLERIS